MYTITDTDDTIHPTTPEEDAAYNTQGKEIREDCEALLATVRHLLTGCEIDNLEAAINGGDKGVDCLILETLRIQFYAQICNFKDGKATV